MEENVSQWAKDIVFVTGGIISFIVIIGLSILMLLMIFDLTNKQEDYIKTLDEHDKAVLMTYKSINPRIYFKKKGKKNDTV